MGYRVERHKKERGFTLVEVIVAISILTIGLLAVGSMQSAAIRGNSFANRLTEGATWAQDKLEELLALPNGHGDLIAGDHGPETATSRNNTYRVSWSVIDSVNPSDPLENAKLITVTVEWRDRGVTKKTQLQCIRAQFS